MHLIAPSPGAGSSEMVQDLNDRRQNRSTITVACTYPHSEAISVLRAASSTATPSPAIPISGVSSVAVDMLLFFVVTLVMWWMNESFEGRHVLSLVLRRLPGVFPARRRTRPVPGLSCLPGTSQSRYLPAPNRSIGGYNIEEMTANSKVHLIHKQRERIRQVKGCINQQLQLFIIQV